MKPHRLKVSALIIALGTAGLFAQDVRKITPADLKKITPPDPQTLAAQREAVRSRALAVRAANAAAATNGLAQGGPGGNTGVDSGGQTNIAKTGIAADKVPSVSSPAVIGAALSVGTSPSVGAAPGTK